MCRPDNCTIVTMNVFKVVFNDNKAISAKQVTSHHNSVEMNLTQGKREIKWLIIYANDMQESINRANRIVKKYFLFLYFSKRA